MDSAADVVALSNGLLLLALTVRALWGWVFAREHADVDSGARLTRLEQTAARLEETLADLRRHTDLRLDTEAADRRRHFHDVDNNCNRLVIDAAVLAQRVKTLEDLRNDRSRDHRGRD